MPRFLRLALIGCVLSLIGLGLAGTSSQAQTAAASARSGDDGWRRTAQGWEQIASENGTIRSGSGMNFVAEHRLSVFTRSQASSHRLEFHPALFAALQAGVVLFALWRHSPKQSLPSKSLP